MSDISTDKKVLAVISLLTACNNRIQDKESVTLWLRYQKLMILLSFCSTFYAGSNDV